MAPDWKYKNHPADKSLKEDLSIDTTFDPSYISWDTPFQSRDDGPGPDKTHLWTDPDEGQKRLQRQKLSWTCKKL